jgi:hypothetical protein
MNMINALAMGSIWFCMLLAPGYAAHGQDGDYTSQLAQAPLFTDLRAAATSTGIPLDGISSASSNGLAPGDSLTAVITLHQDKDRRTEWLVFFQIVAMTNAPVARPVKPEVLYNAEGDRFEFARSPVKFRIRTLGPYLDSTPFWGKPEAKDQSASVSVNGAWLQLGLNEGMAAIYRINQAHGTNFDFWAGGRPPAEAERKKNQKLAEIFQVSAEEKRALAGWAPAMFAYFSAVGQTPGLDMILWKLINLPSMWSIVRHGGVTASIDLETEKVGPLRLPASWTLPEQAPVFTLPLSIELNRQPALNATLFVADPRPSLLASGGIVGFLARNPRDEQNYMTLRVISTRDGAGRTIK